LGAAIERRERNVDIVSALTIIVALYGAVVSTILAIHELRKGKPRLKVTASHGYLYNALGKPSEPVILMEALNIGSGSIPLNGVGWLNQDGSKQHIIVPYPVGILPTDLAERKKLTEVYACRSFRENLDNAKVAALYFQDQSGKLWIAKVTPKEKRSWLDSKGDGWRIA
jgi:hypothetical protein